MLEYDIMTPYQQKQLDLMRRMETSLSRDPSVSTIIPFQSDYAADPQMALSLNAFLPADAARTIQTTLIEPLKAIDPTQYFYPSQSLHITFHSIRIIHDPPSYTYADIRLSRRLLDRIVPSQRAFPFILHGVFSLPTSVFIAALATPRYGAFIRTVRKTLTDAGIPDDKTYFSDKMVFANTTICRYTHPPTPEFLKKVSELRDRTVGKILINNVALVETNAGANPSKTVILKEYGFGQNRG